jgi:hypothetical protein
LATLGALALGVLSPDAAFAQDPKADERPKQSAPKKRAPKKRAPKKRVQKKSSAKQSDGDAKKGTERAASKKKSEPDSEEARAKAKPGDDGDELKDDDAKLDDADVVAAVDANVPEGDAPHYVLGTKGNRAVVDLGTEHANVGEVIELWRPIELVHPVTGEIVKDKLLVGRMRLERVGSALSLATPVDDAVAVEPGDIVLIKTDEGAEEPTADEEAVDADPEAKGGVHAIELMWSSLRGASLKKRILTYEAFVTRFPKSPHAVVLWEEAQSLRELAHKRVEPDLPPPPKRPIGASSSIASMTNPGGDEPSIDFDALPEPGAEKPKLAGDDGLLEEEKPRGYHRHDGGFIRFGYGPGWFNGSYDGNFRASANGVSVPASVGLTGLGLSAEFVGGGAPVPGFVLAARVALTVAVEPEALLSDVGGTDKTADDMVIPFTGFLMDVYPDPELGIHFFGTVGVTMAEVGGPDELGDQSFVGVGYGGGIGFEGWIADEWSLGVQARIDAAYMAGEETDVDDDVDTFTMVNPTIQMAFTFN